MGLMARRNSQSSSGRVPVDRRPQGPGSHWRRDGTSKTSYMSRGEALSVAEESSRETGLQLEVYRCAECSAWHLGNPPERA
jgi:hypothetical protein